MWFQHDHDIDEKPEFLRIKRACGLDPLLVRGALSAWFEQVNKHGEFLLDGSNRGIMRGYALIDLVDLIGVDVAFWQIVASEGWIEETSDGLIVPKFVERFGKLASKQKRGTVDTDQPKKKRGRPPKRKPDEQEQPQATTNQDVGDSGTVDRVLPAGQVADASDDRVSDCATGNSDRTDAAEADHSRSVRDIQLARLKEFKPQECTIGEKPPRKS